MYSKTTVVKCISAVLAASACVLSLASCMTDTTGLTNTNNESTPSAAETSVEESSAASLPEQNSKPKASNQNTAKNQNSAPESSKEESSKPESSKPESSKPEQSSQQVYTPVRPEPQPDPEPEPEPVQESEEESSEIVPPLPPKPVPIYRGRNSGTFPEALLTIPWDYYKPLEGTRPIEVVSYTHRGHTKNVSVYLPPNYDENKSYNIIYLLGGVTANEWAFFKRGDKPDYCKYALDHLITNGEMEPCIVANCSFFPSDDIRLGDMDFTEMLNDFDDELRNCIIPAVESEYSTYIVNMNEMGIIASRKHRAFGGFSMGAAVTWHELAKNTDYFYYYAPFSGGSFETENLDYNDDVGGSLRRNLSRLGYDKNDFFIFACEGTADHTKNKMDNHVNNLRNNFPDVFEFTDTNKSQGNITYKYKQDGEHNYVCAYEYLRSAIHAFWEI